MSEEKEVFVERWSRLKTEAREAPKEPSPPAEKQEQAPAVLPPVEDLTPQSDFAPFMNAEVDDGTRRAALKKLFTDTHFNAPDPFEAYSEDYTGGEPIPMEMLKTLNQARRLIFEESEKTAQAPEPEPKPADDGAGKQDT